MRTDPPTRAVRTCILWLLALAIGILGSGPAAALEERASVVIGKAGTTRVKIEKGAEFPLPLCPGDTVHYSLRITNTSDDDTGAQGAEIVDPTPDGASFAGGLSGDAVYHSDANRVVWEGVLVPGESHSIGFSIEIEPGLANGTELVNRATGTVGAASKEVELPLTVDCPPLDAGFDKSLDVGGTVCPLTTASYNVTLINKTERDHPLSARIEDPIPAGFTYVSGSVTGGAAYEATADRIVWEGELDPGAGVTFGFQVQVDEGTAGTTLTNEVTAALLDSEVGDSAELRDMVSVPVEECPPLSAEVEKTASASDPLCPGSLVSYAIELTNTSSRSESLTARLVDEIPEELGILEDTLSGNAQFDSAKNEVTWEGVLGPGEGHTIGFDAFVRLEVDPGTFVNHADATLIDELRNEIFERSDGTIHGVEDCVPEDSALEVKVLSTEGAVDCRLPGSEEWAPCEEGQVLPPGTMITSGFPPSKAKLGVLLGGQEVGTADIEHLSKVTLTKSFFEAETETVETEIEVDFGEVEVEVETKRYRSDTKISAPDAVTGIRGTDLTVTTNALEDQTTLFEGAIEVTLLKSGEVHEFAVTEGEAPLRFTTDGVSILGECRVGEAGCAPLPFPVTDPVERVSLSDSGTEAEDESAAPSVSADGSIVAFSSLAGDLTGDFVSAPVGVFVRDRTAGTTELVSRAEDGSPADGVSGAPAVSPDGSAVVFASPATNLTPDDTNGAQDIFVRDLETGAVERVSVADDGGETSGESSAPSLSGDGSVVAFASFADDLVPGDTNGVRDVFVRDRDAGTTQRVNVATDGAEADGPSGSPALSADGRYVVFASNASNLVPGDGNGVSDVFVHDRRTGTTERVSVTVEGGDPSGASDFPSISADGRFVAFISLAPDLIADDANGTTPDVFVRDRKAGTTELVSVRTGGSPGSGVSNLAAISPDGRYVAFRSAAEDLFPGDDNGVADLFLHDRSTGETRLISVGVEGSADGSSTRPALAEAARLIVFDSEATDLVATDTNQANDVFAVPYTGTEMPADELPEDPDDPEEPPPDPPAGPWLTSAELPGFEAKVRITPPGGEPIDGAAEPECITETLCVSGALAGRPEIFAKVIGPRPNGKLWTQIARFTPSRVEVWLRQIATQTVRYYDLEQVGRTSDDVSGLQDREAFDPAGGTSSVPRGVVLPGAAVEPFDPVRPILVRPLEPGQPEPPADLEWLADGALPGFRFKARITPAGGQALGGRRIERCIPETLCIQGALAGRPEVFAKIIGPRPNGFLWVQAARFTPSRVELWVKRTATGTVRYYRLEPVGRTSEDVSGLQDREAFAP